MTAPREDLAPVAYMTGLEHLKGRRLEEALAEFNRSLALRPDDGETWELQAVTLCLLRRNEQAEASAERAAKLDPAAGSAVLIVQGRKLLDSQNFEEAFRAFDLVSGEHLWELSTVLRRWRAEALFGIGRAEEALIALNDIVKENPDDADAWMFHGKALNAIGLVEEAQDSYERFRTLLAAEAGVISEKESGDADVQTESSAPDPAVQSAVPNVEAKVPSEGPSIDLVVTESDEQTESSAPDPAVQSAVPNAKTKVPPEAPSIDLAELVASDNIAEAESEEQTSPDDQVREKAILDILPRAVSDMPSETDSLGFTPLVDGLYAPLNAEETRLPMAIAITAPWGSGKSSVMLQLEDRLRESPGADSDGYSRRWYTVRLDVWKYEKSERLWAAMAKAIYDQPQSRMGLLGRIWFRLSLEWRREARALLAKTAALTVLGGAGLAALALVSAVAWKWVTTTEASPDNAAIIAAATGGTGLSAGMVAAVTRFWGIAAVPSSGAYRATCPVPGTKSSWVSPRKPTGTYQTWWSFSLVRINRPWRCLWTIWTGAAAGTSLR